MFSPNENQLIKFYWPQPIPAYSYISYRNQSFDLHANQMTGFYMKCNTQMKWVK